MGMALSLGSRLSRSFLFISRFRWCMSFALSSWFGYRKMNLASLGQNLGGLSCGGPRNVSCGCLIAGLETTCNQQSSGCDSADLASESTGADFAADFGSDFGSDYGEIQDRAGSGGDCYRGGGCGEDPNARDKFSRSPIRKNGIHRAGKVRRIPRHDGAYSPRTVHVRAAAGAILFALQVTKTPPLRLTFLSLSNTPGLNK